MKPPWAVAFLLLGVPGFASVGPEPVDGWVAIGGIRVHYLERQAGPRQAGPRQAGPRQGPTVLMVHGWTGSAADFRPVMDYLPASWRIIAVDLPGCGRSDKPDAPYDLPFFLDSLRKFVDALGLARFVMVGHSLGGQIAVHFTERWPDSVEKLVLIAPYGLKGEEGALGALADWGALVDIAFRLNTRLFIEWAVRGRLLYKPSDDTVRAAVDSASWILGPDGSRAIARITRRMIGHDLVETILPRIAVECLVIWGDHDPLLPPSWADRFMALLPRARFAGVKDSGHKPMVERPAQTASILSDFIGT